MLTLQKRGIMRKLTIALSSVAFAVGAVFVVSHAVVGSVPYATLYDADVNHDGKVSVQDAEFVWSKLGQAAPLPTATPLPVGSGAEYVIAHDVVLQSQMGVATFYAADPSVCPGSILYLAARSLSPDQVSLELTVFGNSSNVNVDPTGDYYVFLQNGSPNTQIDLTPLGSNLSIAVTLELHCRPTLP
jgi:hypothetical protein